MTIEFGAEFNTNATPSQEMLFRLRALAESGALGGTLGSRDEKDAARQLEIAIAMSELQRRLADPEYAALYNRVSEKLDDAFDAVARAREALAKEQAELDATLSDMRARAATLEDGTRVYQRDDGTWLTEDGEEIPADEIALADIPENATRWEDMQSALERSHEIEQEQAELDGYERDVLHPAKERLEDEDNPPSEEELNEIGQRIETQRPSFLSRSKPNGASLHESHTEIGRSAADEHMPEGRIKAPDVSGQFAEARATPAVPDLDLDLPARPSVTGLTPSGG